MRKPETSDVIIGTGVAILVILIGTLVDKALDLLGFQAVAVGVTIAIVIILGIIAVVWFLGRKSYESELIKAIESIRNISLSSKYDWLYSSGDIDEIERTAKYSDIWIVSSDLSNDTGNVDGPIISIIKKNLRRGITYTYIIPKVERTRAVFPHLQQIFSSHPQQLNVVRVAPERFDLLIMTHIAIYNPNMEGGQPPQVFIELPIDIRGYGRGYWIRVSEDIAFNVIGRLRTEIESMSGVESSQ